MAISIPQFLLESSFCLGIFYVFYYWFLRKETFFQFNRGYLVLMPALSLVIPLLNIKWQPQSGNQPLDAIYPLVVNAHEIQHTVWQQIEQPTPAFSLTIADLLMIIYGIGMLLMGWRLAKGLWRLGSPDSCQPKK